MSDILPHKFSSLQLQSLVPLPHIHFFTLWFVLCFVFHLVNQRLKPSLRKNKVLFFFLLHYLWSMSYQVAFIISSLLQTPAHIPFLHISFKLPAKLFQSVFLLRVTVAEQYRTSCWCQALLPLKAMELPFSLSNLFHENHLPAWMVNRSSSGNKTNDYCDNDDDDGNGHGNIHLLCFSLHLVSFTPNQFSSD